jgi:hypothetical protein
VNPKYILIAVFLSFCTGWTVHGWKYDANLKSALQKTITLQHEYDAYARKVVASYNTKQAEQVIVYRNIKKDIPNVTDNRICFADSNALSLWNAALTGMPSTTTGVVETPSVTDTAVLTNAIENFEQSKQTRDQLNALIDWYEGLALQK